MSVPISMYLDLIEKIVLNEINPENAARMHYLVHHIHEKRTKPWFRTGVVELLVDIHRTDDFYRSQLAKPDDKRDWWLNQLGFPYTMAGRKRIENVRKLTETVLSEDIPGAFVETGVWRGGCCIMMKAVLKAMGYKRDVYLCDSFEGLPEITEGPDAELKLHNNPILSAPLEHVQSHFKRLELLDEGVVFVKGWFEDSMPVLKDRIDKIALLRLDGDYYTSTMSVLEALAPKVSRGGYIIIDDFGTYEQCKQAVTDYFGRQRITVDPVWIDDEAVYWKV